MDGFDLNKLFNIELKTLEEIDSSWMAFKNALMLSHTYYADVSKDELLVKLKIVKVLLSSFKGKHKDNKKMLAKLKSMIFEIKEAEKLIKLAHKIE